MRAELHDVVSAKADSVSSLRRLQSLNGGLTENLILIDRIA
jgi:hypothetical protein